MSYIGRGIDQIDNISTLDNLSFNGSSTTFNLTQNSVAFVPVSADALQIQIDGIIQSGNFSTSGSTVTFNFTPNSQSVCNSIKHFGVGVAFTPSSGSVTKDKTNFVSTSSSAGLEIKGDGTTDGTLQLNCSQNSHGIKLKSPPHSASASYTLTFPNDDGNANQFLQTNGSGVLSFANAGGTNTPMFHANFGNTSGTTMSHDTGTKMAFDTEDIDTDNCYSVSNYRFTPNVSGTYFFYGQISMNSSTDYNNKYSICEIKKNGTAITTHNNQNSYYTSTRAIAVTTMNGSSDYVECFGYHTFGTNVDANASNLYSYFGGYKLIT